MTDGNELVNGHKGWQSQTTAMGGIAMAETSKGGLTKRELFAAMAMQAIRSGGGSYAKWSDLSEDAVAIADALIAELNKETTT